MTMLLGINLRDHAFLSADTRATYATGEKKDNVQKIEFLPERGLIVAAAGSARLASEIFSAIKNGITSVPVTANSLANDFDKILDKFLKKKIISIDQLNPVAMIFHEFDGNEIHMRAVHVEFTKWKSKMGYKIHGYSVRNREYICVGDIGENGPIQIGDLPDESKKFIDNNDPNKITYYDYALATDMIFETAKKTGHTSIGGKTISLKTFVDSNKKCKYVGVRGLKSIIHEANEFQDVSMVTDFDVSSNRFYLRDMRNDGMIITNIEYLSPGVKPILRYDSCPKDSGVKDMYYIGFSEYDMHHDMNLEF